MNKTITTAVAFCFALVASPMVLAADDSAETTPEAVTATSEATEAAAPEAAATEAAAPEAAAPEAAAPEAAAPAE